MIDLEKVKQRAEADAKTNGYYLNPDREFLQNLLEGLRQNQERYGYPSCPCRLASGKFENDRDIICPCDYRDPDVIEFGACYCALFVQKKFFEDKSNIKPVPERRPLEKQVRAYEVPTKNKIINNIPLKENDDIHLKLWYCKQCGYVTFRENPPYICPICKANKEMFSELRISSNMRG